MTRVTVGDDDGKTSLRVSMARESSPTWLSPAPPADLRQPGIIRSLLGNGKVALSIVGQEQDGRYVPVRSEAEVATLADAIRRPTRLPILLIHTRTRPAMAVARHVALRLVGLVRVVTLDFRASRALDVLLPGFAPPWSGARLVWSDAAARTLPFEDRQVNAADPDVLRGQLMRVLAPVSVLARGVDQAYREARSAEIADRDRDARARSMHALAQGSPHLQIEALQEELETARASANTWEQLARDEEERANLLTAQVSQLPELEAQVEQLTIALRASRPPAGDELVDDDPWSTLPDLVTGDSDSAEDLFLHLTDATSGHIVFTTQAASIWKKSSYPFPDEMTECLTKLAHAAATLYDGTDRNLPHLDNWFRENFDLKVALQDDTIERNAKLRYFDYEGKTYDRTPHVKVRDHTAPTQVGRIHFALDSDKSRLIVAHVGVKLY
ncbi:hypothetical protein [Kribbella speibonae]|uniref:Uncharacterized protein n=1 Tax=Kribbella speibonae TaxID=1572660 RepID=A0A4R0IH44_9ACTN|nr:hypothetical protein [Kribbella speibonae]TCC32663.1 hypothetical protein E0H92_31230 [Kribbella speibonae]